MQTQIKILGHEFSITWAKATLGLSLLISGIIELGVIMSGIANKIKKNDISKALGLDELAKSAENAEYQIESLQYRIDKFDGIDVLVKRWEALNEIQNKNANQISSMDKLFMAKYLHNERCWCGYFQHDKGKAKSFIEHIKQIAQNATKRLGMMLSNIRVLDLQNNLMQAIGEMSQGTKYDVNAVTYKTDFKRRIQKTS